MNLLRNTIIVFVWVIILTILAFVFPLAAAMFMLTSAITLILRPGLRRAALNVMFRPNPHRTGGSSTVGEIRGQTGTPTINVIGNGNSITINQPASDGARYAGGQWHVGPGRLVEVTPEQTIRRIPGGVANVYPPYDDRAIGNPYDPDSGPVFGPSDIVRPCHNCDGPWAVPNAKRSVDMVYKSHVFDDVCMYVNAPESVREYANRNTTPAERQEDAWLRGQDIIDAANALVLPGDRRRLDAKLYDDSTLECAVCGLNIIDHALADHEWEEIEEI